MAGTTERLEAERDHARDAHLAGTRDLAEAEAELDVTNGALVNLRRELDDVHGVVVTTTQRLEGERDEARAAHRAVERELLSVQERLRSYDGSRTAGLARAVWAVKRRLASIQRRPPTIEYPELRSALHAPVPGSSPQAETHATSGLPDPVRVPTDPVVSIVIPVHGQVELTAQCLASIVEHTDSTPYEVIVVDDESPDATAVWLSRCENVKVVTNLHNLGYLRSTNAGVAASNAPYVCLLNNDTEVHPGWIEALLAPMLDDPSVGAVGAKLVYPDGRLQEAGGIIFSDGSGWNFGRNGDPEAPEVNFVREVDYCSAACLLVDRRWWDAVGGFDERFVPAYYEDTDLAFALRDAGARVLYQPAAVVTHFEGMSHGTDESEGLKAHQLTNQVEFCTKWEAALAEQPVPGSDPRVASRRGSGSRVLIVDHEVPAPDRDAGSLRMQAIIELLQARGHRVSLLPHNRYPRQPYTADLAARGVEVLYGHAPLPPYLEALADDLDFALISRPEVATELLPVVRSVLPELPIAYDMVDFHSLRFGRQAARTGSRADSRKAEQVGSIERRLFCDADVVIAVSEHEAKLIEEFEPGTATAVIPTIHQAPRSTAGFASRNGLLFIGSYRHGPNEDAIDWLFEEILPAVWQRDPAIGFHLVGSDLPEELSEHHDPRVTVHGWIPHLEGIYDQIRLSVAPLRFGAGIKGKVGDSLARGVPVVCTGVGAEGFGPVTEALGVAETVDGLADLMVELHNDEAEWHRRSQRGAELIEDYFGYQAADRALGGLIEQLHARRA